MYCFCYANTHTHIYIVPDSCNRKAWPIEISVDYEITGFQYSMIPNVVDKWRCAQLCIDQNNCKSANYFRKTRMCSLNSETRRSQPTAFNPNPNQVEYLENECADTFPGFLNSIINTRLNKNQIYICIHV